MSSSLSCADSMGGVISDLLEQTSNLGVPSSISNGQELVDLHKNHHHRKSPLTATQDRSRRRTRKAETRPIAPPCTKGHHRHCRQLASRRNRPLSFGERLERIHQLQDPSMAQRSSTPTAGLRCSSPVDTEEEEYGAWTSYLRTPGTFRGQMKPNLKGAFSGMCFPGSDPRWICHHQEHVPAVKAIISN